MEGPLSFELSKQIACGAGTFALRPAAAQALSALEFSKLVSLGKFLFRGTWLEGMLKLLVFQSNLDFERLN